MFVRMDNTLGWPAQGKTAYAWGSDAETLRHGHQQNPVSPADYALGVLQCDEFLGETRGHHEWITQAAVVTTAAALSVTG